MDFTNGTEITWDYLLPTNKNLLFGTKAWKKTRIKFGRREPRIDKKKKNLIIYNSQEACC